MYIGMPSHSVSQRNWNNNLLMELQSLQLQSLGIWVLEPIVAAIIEACVQATSPFEMSWLVLSPISSTQNMFDSEQYKLWVVSQAHVVQLNSLCSGIYFARWSIAAVFTEDTSAAAPCPFHQLSVFCV